MSLSFPVSPKKQEALFEKMMELGIREADLHEEFFKSSGKGGQNLNKVSTAVRILHIPSGIEARCNVYRTQGLNRYKARSILCEKLEAQNLGKESRQEKKFARIRKSKKDKKRKADRKKKEKALIFWKEKFSNGEEEAFSPLQ